MSTNYRDFSNKLSATLNQNVAGTKDKPITLKDIEKNKNNSQTFFARSLNKIKGKTISDSTIQNIIHKNNGEKFNEIAKLFEDSMLKENAPSKGLSNHEIKQFQKDLDTLYNLVKIFNKANSKPFTQKDNATQVVSKNTNETSSNLKPEEILKDTKGIILNMASKTKAMNDTQASTQKTPERELFLKDGKKYIAEHKQFFEQHRLKFEKATENLPNSKEKEALIKEFNNLKAIVESDDLVKAAEPLKPKEGITKFTLPQIELAIVGNYTKVLGVENPFTQGDIKSLQALTYQFEDLARHDPAASSKLQKMGEVITSFATACEFLSADYKLAANKENPIPLDKNKLQEFKDKIQQLRSELAPISFDNTTAAGKTETLALTHLRVRLGIAEKRLNELPS